MYACPNCGGELKFDIESQKLKCSYCQTLVDPYSFQDVRGAKERSSGDGSLMDDEFEVTQFVCPQCGASMISQDNTAAAFCSFCGASTVLKSRVSREKKPDAIIPFKKTKKDCMDSFQNLMRHSLFAPKELRDPSCVDSFRGIYMPYWVYDVKYRGDFTVHGIQTTRDGNYDVTSHYNLTGKIDADYQGITHDASKNFSDDISESIAPYNVREMKVFNASFLSGFYADTADVQPKVYEQDVEELTNTICNQAFLDVPQFKSYSLKTELNEKSTPFRGGTPESHYSLFPVWFMSYRKNDRVGYVTVNGQTGKAAADIPIDFTKYTLGSLLLAVPLFFILNFFLSITAKSALILSALFALLTLIISFVEYGKIKGHEAGLHDRGLHNDTSDNGRKNVFVDRLPRIKSSKNRGKHFSGKSFLYVLYFFLLIASSGGGLIALMTLAGVILLGAGICKLIDFDFDFSPKPKFPTRSYGFAGSLIALITALAILIRNPVSDYFYYIGAMVSAAAIFITMIEIIKNYNLLSTRELPQFHRRGCDDRAK